MTRILSVCDLVSNQAILDGILVAPGTRSLEVPHKVSASVCFKGIELSFEELAGSLDQRLVPVLNVDIGRALAAVDPADAAGNSGSVRVRADVGSSAELADDDR